MLDRRKKTGIIPQGIIEKTVAGEVKIKKATTACVYRILVFQRLRGRPGSRICSGGAEGKDGRSKEKAQQSSTYPKPRKEGEAADPAG